MPIPCYLAMTGAEFRQFPPDTGKIAWMACHFSPYGRGLSHLPEHLPSGSVLILDDITPIRGHDPETITAQLSQALEVLECSALLLDFQRPGVEETAALTAHLSTALPCPVCISEAYALPNLPVFLPPVPPSQPLSQSLSPWQGRELWLDAALGGEIIQLTGKGAEVSPLHPWETPEEGIPDQILHCHYQIQLTDTAAVFTLWRTRQDLKDLLEEAASLGVTTAVGLWQELA